MALTFKEISRMTLFRGFNQTFIKLLDLFFVENRYSPGQILIQEGTVQTRFFMIFAGEVEVFHMAAGNKTSLGNLCAGQFFGEINLFDPGLATASVASLTPVRTLEISNDQFRAFIQEKPELAADFTFQLAETIVKRFRSTNEQFVEQLTHPDNILKAQEVSKGLRA
jgi:CRP-like cAMP-binding protein